MPGAALARPGPKQGIPNSVGISHIGSRNPASQPSPVAFLVCISSKLGSRLMRDVLSFDKGLDMSKMYPQTKQNHIYTIKTSSVSVIQQCLHVAVQLSWTKLLPKFIYIILNPSARWKNESPYLNSIKPFKMKTIELSDRCAGYTYIKLILGLVNITMVTLRILLEIWPAAGFKYCTLNSYLLLS